MSVIGWTGEKVRLVPPDKQRHFDDCVQCTRLAKEEYFERVTWPNETEFALAIERLDGDPIGLCAFHKIDWRHGGVGTTGQMIGRKELWGRGFGTDAMRVRTRYAFEVVGLRLLLSEVMDGNVASLNALLKTGYREVGRLPQRCWKHGAYRDLILLALPRAEWRPV